MPECIQACTHRDLDGAVSLLALMWAYPEDTISYFTINNLESDTLKKNIEQVNKPCRTFVLDLALREEFLPDLDKEHITFIDHHETSEGFIPRFNNARIIHQRISSNALLMAKTFKGGNFPERSDAQKMLIALADDFDCYRLQIPESYDLNVLFWSEYKNNFTKFIKDYFKGFKPFSDQQKKGISYIKKQALLEASSLPLFFGKLNIAGKSKRTLAVMAEKMSNLVLDTLIDQHKPDLMFFINSKSEKVSLRQCNSNDPINLGTFAEKICSGGGHSNAAGGIITPLFMEICKNLKPIS